MLPKPFFGFLLITLGLSRAEDLHTSAPPINDGLKGKCFCGGFPSTAPEANTEPLLSQSPGLEVNCDEEGSTKCKSLCHAIATAAKAKGSEILCNRLKNADELKLSAFFKICEKPWLYADMTADEALCCQDAEVKTCPSAEHLTTMTNKE